MMVEKKRLHSNGLRMCCKVGVCSHHDGRMGNFLYLAFRKANLHQTYLHQTIFGFTYFMDGS